MSGGEGKRTVRMFCPPVAKSVSFMACDEERIDLGYISRAFGLEPATLKLNNHFIGRGPDLVASSVTWRSLLSFFSSRGLPTGGSNSDAIVVHGKLCKTGTKRAPEVDGTENEIYNADNTPANLRLQFEDFNLFKNKKLKGKSSESIDWNNEVNSNNSFSLKRKRQQEDFSSLKRLTIK